MDMLTFFSQFWLLEGFIVPYVIAEGAKLSASFMTVLAPALVDPPIEDYPPLIDTPEPVFFLAASIC